MYVQSRNVRTWSAYAVIGVGTSATLQYAAGPDGVAATVGATVGVGDGVGVLVGVAVGAADAVAVATAVAVGVTVADGGADGDGVTAAPPQAEAMHRAITNAVMRRDTARPLPAASLADASPRAAARSGAHPPTGRMPRPTGGGHRARSSPSASARA